jgi:hypothetical protein
VVLIQAVDNHHTQLVGWLGTTVPQKGARLEVGDPSKTYQVKHVVWSPIPAEKRTSMDSPEAIVTLVCRKI